MNNTLLALRVPERRSLVSSAGVKEFFSKKNKKCVETFYIGLLQNIMLDQAVLLIVFLCVFFSIRLYEYLPFRYKPENFQMNQ